MFTPSKKKKKKRHVTLHNAEEEGDTDSANWCDNATKWHGRPSQSKPVTWAQCLRRGRMTLMVMSAKKTQQKTKKKSARASHDVWGWRGEMPRSYAFNVPPEIQHLLVITVKIVFGWIVDFWHCLFLSWVSRICGVNLQTQMIVTVELCSYSLLSDMCIY